MDEAAFLSLIERHAKVMASAVRRVCGRRHQALVPDIEQEIYSALWKRLQGGKGIDHPVSYLYKMALTTALEAVRKQTREVSPLGDAQMDERPASAGGFAGLLPAEKATLMGQLLDRMSPDEARAVRAYLAGFSHGEVADLFGWTPSVARHRIYRAIETLKRRMKGESE